MSFRAAISGFAAALAIGASLALSTTSVFAHATITDVQWNNPASPTQVIATSGEDDISTKAGTFYLKVFNVQGQEVDKGDWKVSANNKAQMSVSVQPGLVPGGYFVHWTTVSADDGDEDDGVISLLLPQLTAPVAAPAPAAVGPAPQAVAAAVQPQAVQPQAAVRPQVVQAPNTGDGGLLAASSRPDWQSFALSGAVLGLFLITGWQLIRRQS